MKSSLFFVLIMLVIAGCTAVNSPEPPNWTNEELAEAMMASYPEDEVEYKIIGRSFGSEEITFEFTEISPDTIENLTIMGGHDIVSPDGSHRAFEGCIELENKCRSRLFIEDLESGKIVEVTFSIQMSWRSLSGIEWVNNNILAFSQWSNPHYGFRFAVDANTQKHILSLVTADQCFISGDCEN